MKNRGKEIFYYLFFILMILAKGIGLDSGDKLYYVLSAAACLCVGCKLILTKYEKKQIAAMMLLGVIAFAAYKNSGRMGILLSVLTIIGLKDMDIKKLFRLGAYVYTAAFSMTVILAKLGVISNPLVVHEKAGIEVIRWGMGYSTGNIFHVSYFMFTVFLCYNLGKRYNLKWLLGFMAGNLLVFLYSLSYTGVAVTTFYLLLNLYAVKRSSLSRAEKVICQLPLPLCLIFSLGAPFLLEHPIVQRIDHWMQARLTFSAYYLQNQPITLLGTRMKNVPDFWIIMDNGYVYILMTFGVAALALFALGYTILIARYSGIAGKEKERLPELAMIFSFLLYGIMEQFIANSFMNLSLLFMGEVLFREKDRMVWVKTETCVALFGGEPEDADKLTKKQLSEETNGESQKQLLEQIRELLARVMRTEKDDAVGMSVPRYLYGIGAVVGFVILTGWLVFVPVKEYIEVPLNSLNCVDAQSVQIYVLEADETKDTLREEMKQYRQQIEQEQVLEEALVYAGVAERMSAEELRKALEYSLPTYIHSKEKKDVFRLRVLNLYQDITKEEYKELLEYLVETAQENGTNRYAVKLGEPANPDGIFAAADDRDAIRNGIYSEQVGKSFGTDRIEHISDSFKYTVEKGGAIVRIEHVRDAVFAAVLGILLVTVGGVLITRMGKSKKNCG